MLVLSWFQTQQPAAAKCAFVLEISLWRDDDYLFPKDLDYSYFWGKSVLLINSRISHFSRY